LQSKIEKKKQKTVGKKKRVTPLYFLAICWPIIWYIVGYVVDPTHILAFVVLFINQSPTFMVLLKDTCPFKTNSWHLFSHLLALILAICWHNLLHL
jgi:Flp pilus assembly protein TadB